MSTTTRKILSGASTLALAAVSLLGATAAPAQAAPTTPTADATLAQDLRFCQEEERMARDLFDTLAEHYDGANPFATITLSEQRHFDAVSGLLVRYDVADPSAGLPAGTYFDPVIQDLYDKWLAQGLTSLDAAYDVGVELETKDISVLESVLDRVTETDVTRVLENILEGSYHHLDAYEEAAEG